MLASMGCTVHWEKIKYTAAEQRCISFSRGLGLGFNTQDYAPEGRGIKPSPRIRTAGGTGSAAEYAVTVSRTGALRGGTFSLNATPDLLPVAAVAAAFAEGDTVLTDIAHARIKETDRIALMAALLAGLGVRCTELPGGLVIHGDGSGLAGGCVDGHGDHRIVMAFAAAAPAAQAPIEIEGAQCAAVSFPGFLEMLHAEAAQ
jgi:3-phosphoshikimate 1-carboxyvinyltransferase